MAAESDKLDKRVSNTHLTLRNIMAATDFSAHSESILTHAAAIARRYQSKLYVAHVIPTDVYRSVPAEVMEEALKQTREYVQDAMASQLRFEFLQRVQNEAVIQEGLVAPELLKLVAERKIGLLVIGTRGHHRPRPPAAGLRCRRGVPASPLPRVDRTAKRP